MKKKMVKARINGLALDVSTNSPVVILSPEGSEKVLPIWIGHFEAWAISMELSGLASKRPLTHDLIASLVKAVGGKVKKVEVTDLVEQTFYAKIYLEVDSKVMNIDARPSDSLAVALKTKAPIYVNDALFTLSKEDKQKSGLPDTESLRDRLRRINPEDFGKYTL
jgi:bifunctional DNase/RNase